VLIKKDQYIFTLLQLYNELDGSHDQEVKESIDFLISKINQTISNAEERSELVAANFPVPSELASLAQGIAIFSDGACRGNPGPGGWACLCQNHQGEILFELCGAEALTTNNKMEMMGAIQGFNRLKDIFISDRLPIDVPVFLFSDSRYVIDGLSSWLDGWKRRGWKKADNKEPENIELWKLLDEFRSFFNNIKFIWVKGHAGHPQNEYCDKLATKSLAAMS